MSRKRILFVVFGVVAALASSHASPPGQHDGDDADRFRPRDIFELEFADNPQISPDGSRIVYLRTSMDIMIDRPRTNLWIVDSDGNDHRPLLSGRTDYASPRWSPDGERLAYVSDAEGSRQLYVRWMDTGQTALLTNLQESPSDIAWSPDGAWLAFTMPVPVSKPPLAEPPEKPEGAEWAPPVKLIDTLVYREDGEGFLEASYSHVFVVPAIGGTPRQLTAGNFNHDGPLSWLPDGTAIVFAANRDPRWEYQPLETELYSVDVADGRLNRLTHRLGPDKDPAVSPDGRRIAYVGFDDHEQGYQVTHLYILERDTGESRLLAADLDRDIQAPRWSADGRGVYFMYDDHGTRKLAYITLEGRLKTLAGQLGGVQIGRPYTSGSYSVADDRHFAFTVNDSARPADAAVGDGRHEPRRLTRLNEDLLGHKRLGQVSELSWPSSYDGREIQGWLITPPGFDSARRYPLILEIHGGPFAAYGPNFSAEMQLYAAAGYVVLYANPRGSTSYGEEFGNLIHHAYPGNDYADLMSGVDAVIAGGTVNVDELFVTGGSGGGVLTAWIVGKTDRFRAAAVAKPAINWTSFALTADYANFFYKYWFSAYPWDKPDEYWQRSPLALAGRVSTPTLLLSGEADYRTPISESEQFYQALKLRGVDTVLVRVPEASHGIGSRPSNMIAKVTNILAWFGKYRQAPQ